MKWALLLIMGIIGLNGCVLLGGQDTETGREKEQDFGLQGVLLNGDGNPAVGAVVELRKSGTSNVTLYENYDTFVVRDTVDDLGRYNFKDLDSSSTYALLGKGVNKNLIFKDSIGHGDSLTNLILLPSRSFAVSVEYIDYIYGSKDSTFIILPGTDIVSPCVDSALIEGVPVGAIQLTMTNAKKETGNIDVPQNSYLGGDQVKFKATKYFNQPYVIVVEP